MRAGMVGRKNEAVVRTVAFDDFSTAAMLCDVKISTQGTVVVPRILLEMSLMCPLVENGNNVH